MYKTTLRISLLINILVFSFAILFLFFKREKIENYLIYKANRYLLLPDPYHWKSRISIYNELEIPEKSIVFLGDSLVEFSSWSEFLEGPIINRGVAGIRISDLKRYDLYKKIPKSSSLIILIGINDFWSKRPYEEIIADLKNLSQELTSFNKVYFLSLLPFDQQYLNTRVEEVKNFNRSLKDICKTNGFQFIDLVLDLSKNGEFKIDREYTFDGVHLSGKAYKVIANKLKKEIKF